MPGTRLLPLCWLWLPLALACATAPPPPAPGLSPEAQRLERLLVSLHFPQFAERLEEASLRAAGHPRDRSLPAGERLRPRIESQLEPRALVSEVARNASAELDPAQLAEVETYFASETGRKVVGATGEPYSWLSRLGYRTFGRLKDQPPERVELVERLDQLTRTRISAAALYVALYESILRWYAARGALEGSGQSVDVLVTRQRQQLHALGKQHLVPFSLWVLRDLSTPELSDYVAFMGSPAAQSYATAVRDAMRDAIASRAAAIGR
jgi:hypothetical protein